MHDIVISTAYAASAAAISIAAVAKFQFKLKNLQQKLRVDYELQAHLFSCASLSLAYALHAAI